MGLKCNFLIILLAIGLASAASSANDIPSEHKGNAKAKCEGSYSIMCLKLDILSLIDKLSSSNKEFNIASGIVLVRENNPNRTQNSKIVSELARAFPDSPEKRLNGFLIAKLQDVLSSYSLKLKLMSDDSTGVFESRGGGGGGFGGGKEGKKGGGMGAMLGMAMMMKGTLMAVALAAIAALAGKALLTAIMALTLAALAGLKSLTGGGDKKTTYEIISKPVYSHSHSHTTGHSAGHIASHEDAGHFGGGGYGRSFINSFPLPDSVKE